MTQPRGSAGKGGLAGRAVMVLVMLLTAFVTFVVVTPGPLVFAGWLFSGPFSGYTSIYVIPTPPGSAGTGLFSRMDRGTVILSDPRGRRSRLTFENCTAWLFPMAVLIRAERPRR